MNKHLQRIARGERVYQEYEVTRYGGNKEIYWKCYDRDGYPLHHGSFSDLDTAIKQVEGVR